MLYKAGLVIALVAAAQAVSPVVRSVRSQDGKTDMVFVVEDGAKVGMMVGGETKYFNDFEGDIQKVGEGNVNAMSLGVDIGRSWVNNFTEEIMKNTAKLSAMEVKADLLEKINDVDQDVDFAVLKMASACKMGQYEKTPATNTDDAALYTPPVCEDLTECEDDQWEKEVATMTSDRDCEDHKTCEADEFVAMAGGPYSDTVCKKITVCKSDEEEVKAPTTTSDRSCRAALPKTCEFYAGQGSSKRTVQSRINGAKGAATEVYCLNDGTDLGGDGSTSAKAGKSCGTIRRRFQATTDKVYWVFMNDTNAPVQVYCDMNSCGNDAALSSPRWGNRRTDFQRCGGWSMAFKYAGTDRCSGNGNGGTRDCYYFNRNNLKNLRHGAVFGTHTTLALENAMSHSYARQSFSDIMWRSLTTGWRKTQDSSVRKYQSVAWRHPWVATSLVEVAQGCRVRFDGELLLPNNRDSKGNDLFNVQVSNNHRHLIGQGINWASSSMHDHYSPENPRTRFGFFGHDGGGCANNRNVVGCQFEYSGHARHFIGWHLGNNDPDRPGGGWGSRITSFGVGAGYCSANGGGERYSATGHWWGHGSSNMQTRTSAIFVRDKTDML